MEIRIKTQDEFQQGHVTIEISGTQHEAEIVADRLASDAGTIEGLRDRVSDLEQELATAQRAREIETQRANNAEALAAAQHERAKESEAEARSYREEMQRRFTTAQVADAKEGAREDERARLTREELNPRQKILTSISQAVYGPDQMQALDRLEESEADYVQVLARAVREVRKILGPGV